MQKKVISVCVPAYNEKDNILTAYERIIAVTEKASDYDFEIVFYDDGSTDGSRGEIERLCSLDKRVKAVFYTRNFGYSKTVFYCMQQARGDAALIIHCDLQNPPEYIPEFIEKWEQGSDVVLGVKSKSRENRFVFFLRTLCYLIANFLFGMHLEPHSTEFELFDRSFLDILKTVDASTPFLRGLVKQYAKHVDRVYYVQDRRERGKSHFRLRHYYEFAAAGMVSMSKCVPRRTIVFSLISTAALAAEFFIRFLPKAFSASSGFPWDGLVIRFCGFILLVMLTVVALLFEYVISFSENAVKKPMIVEEKRINF